MLEEEDHYLAAELSELFRSNPTVLTWLDQGSLDGLWFWNLEKPEDEWLSPRFKRTFGYAVDEVPHASAWWQEHIHPDDLEAALERYEAHHDDPNEPYDLVVRYRHKKGHTVWIRCRGLMIRDDTGRPVRMLGAHTDVTELKEAEARLARRNAELERSNRELEELARVMAHDLRSPLRSIVSFGQLLADEHRDALNDEGKAFLDFMVDGAKRMRLMIDGLVEIARIDGVENTRQPVSLDEVLATVVANTRGALEAKGGALEKRGDFGSLNGVYVQLVQLFQNLVENGIKFSRGAPHITVTGRREADLSVVEVVDRGIGFSAALASRLFHLFERAVTRDEFEGMGVGLAICQRVVDRHGGSIEAHGDPGRGARFVVRLPNVSPEE
ncbi:MAG: ATP-binding protein [Myxococcota bacterium]